MLLQSVQRRRFFLSKLCSSRFIFLSAQSFCKPASAQRIERGNDCINKNIDWRERKEKCYVIIQSLINTIRARTCITDKHLCSYTAPTIYTPMNASIPSEKTMKSQNELFQAPHDDVSFVFFVSQFLLVSFFPIVLQFQLFSDEIFCFGNIVFAVYYRVF